jgi:predicted small secreted protein
MKFKVVLNILLAVVLVVFAVSVSGCKTTSESAGDTVLGAHQGLAPILGGHGMGETEAERTDDLSRQLRVNGSEMIDDIDAWMMTDRESRLTEFTVR